MLRSTPLTPARPSGALADRANFRDRRVLWHNGRLSTARPCIVAIPPGGRTREAKPVPGIPPGSLNCSVHTQEKSLSWL
ncbi:hypothetical protein MMSP_2210 [Mycobacterium sp. 012931]|nr:hypothetical protein MMSP_2210 [Mycobacterium sp. 012931]MBC9863516.1 hypothetical protein [Mycobacterium pseudoshottsii]